MPPRPRSVGPDAAPPATAPELFRLFPEGLFSRSHFSQTGWEIGSPWAGSPSLSFVPPTKCIDISIPCFEIGRAPRLLQPPPFPLVSHPPYLCCLPTFPSSWSPPSECRGTVWSRVFEDPADGLHASVRAPALLFPPISPCKRK